MLRGLLVELQDLLQPGEALLRIDVKHFGLLVLFDFAALAEAFEHLDFVAQAGGLFELELLRRRLHLGPHLVEQLLAVAFEKQLQPLDVLAILFLRDAQVAGGGALIDRRQQAGPEPAPALVVGFDVERAGAELEDPLQDLHRAAEAAGAGERAVELHAAGARLAGDLDAREIFVRGDLQIGKGFVVAEVAVELRLDVLDQPGFHQQRVDFALGFDEVDVVRFADELEGALIAGGGGQEVAAGAGAQVVRLADVEHAAGLVLKQVDARRGGKLAPHFLRGPGEKLRLRFGKRRRRALGGFVGWSGRVVGHRGSGEANL